MRARRGERSQEQGTDKDAADPGHALDHVDQPVVTGWTRALRSGGRLVIIHTQLGKHGQLGISSIMPALATERAAPAPSPSGCGLVPDLVVAALTEAACESVWRGRLTRQLADQFAAEGQRIRRGLGRGCRERFLYTTSPPVHIPSARSQPEGHTINVTSIAFHALGERVQRPERHAHRGRAA